MSLVLLQIIGQEILVAKPGIVNERNTSKPVAVLKFSITLNVVLTASEVPHKVTPIHEVTLVGKEEPDILQLVRHLDSHGFATTVVRHLIAVNTSHPRFVSCRMGRTVHAWEQHVLGIFVFILCSDDEIRVLLIGRCFLLALIDRLAFRHDWTTILTVTF